MHNDDNKDNNDDVADDDENVMAMMMMRRVKTIMTTWKCKQCALYLEAQGLFGRAMTSRSEDMMMIVMMVRTFKSFHLVAASS